ncbi:MAG: restriction endonuclease subunit S [Chthoniobacterales bacterium]|nr:restriction endonuclease subunit S [Chthoniobacterales bacterium]
MSHHAGRAFAVQWSQASRWSPGSFREVAWSWPPETIQPLSTVLRRRIECVGRAEHPLDSLVFGSLHFGGELSRRDMSSKQEVKGKLFFAHADDVVYSKIDARNGAIGIVPHEMPLVVFSSEYPIYEVDRERALPEYVKLLFRMASFRQRINSLISGASGRKRVEPSTLEGIEVPLPPLATQQAIVDHWQAAQRKNAAALRTADEQEAETESAFLRDLGLKSSVSILTHRGFALHWSDVERWGVDGLRKTIGGIDPNKSKFAAESLSTVLEFAQYGTSDKANEAQKGVPVLRISNIKDGRISWENLKHIELPGRTEASLKLVDGDILIIRTSGSRDLVGTCGVYRGDRPSVFASYLIRLRIDQSKAVPEFISYFINSPAGRQQVDAVSRQIMQNNINSEEIKGLRIPLPPLAIQQHLVAEVSAARETIAAVRAAAAQRAADTAREVEEMILGHRPASKS